MLKKCVLFTVLLSSAVGLCADSSSREREFFPAPPGGLNTNFARQKGYNIPVLSKQAEEIVGALTEEIEIRELKKDSETANTLLSSAISIRNQVRQIFSPGSEVMQMTEKHVLALSADAIKKERRYLMATKKILV